MSDIEIRKSISVIAKKIKFVDVHFIPEKVFQYCEDLLIDVDLDDTEFVALTEHIHGRLWTGDKVLKRRLMQKNWNKFISTEELGSIITKFK
ncbi:MAG: hypothetical protein K9H64_07690 [Bacteroidales bacterium]|nr:hypothetical protein [Bacteroidales bacterium]MCF8455678.1 hypothetical protein [Bacteroidales bacterium]